MATDSSSGTSSGGMGEDDNVAMLDGMADYLYLTLRLLAALLVVWYGSFASR